MTNIEQYINKGSCTILPKRVSKYLQEDNFLSEFKTDELKELAMLNLLLLDNVPTEGSTKLINSGDLYNLLKDTSTADKLYNKESFSGLGRVYLKRNIINNKNILSQEVFSLSNTIYIIQYDYDLNGAEIIIPENCVLQFEGGSLKNGSINSDNLRIIASNSGIFDNVTFSGSCIANSVCELDWFIKKYPESDNDYSIDNTNEVKDCFASGFKNIKFPNKYIHLTDTITIPKVINILTEDGKSNTNWNFHPTNKKNSRPCVFSNNVVTLFDYQIDSQYDDNGYEYTSSLYIGAIKCFIKKEFNNVDDINVPVINITPMSYLWGIIIDADITATRCQFTINGNTRWYFNYTGIRIATFQSTEQSEALRYCSFVRINGNLVGLNYGVYFHGESHSTNSWFTDVIINGDTQCCYGGVFDNVAPVTIYGNHQSSYLSHIQQTTEPEGYFTGPEIKLYGMVWDCGQYDKDLGYITAMLQVKLTGNVNNSFAVFPKRNFYDYGYYPDSYEKILEPLESYKFPMQNALYRALAPRNNNISSRYINIQKYEANGTNILKDYPQLKNADNLFNDLSTSWIIPRFKPYRNEAYIENSDRNEVNLALSFQVLTSEFDDDGREGSLPHYLLWGCADTNAQITVDVYEINIIEGREEKGPTQYHYTGNGNYYSGRLNVVRFPKRVGKFGVDIICESESEYITLPTVIVPFYGHRDKIAVSSNIVGRPNFKDQERYGVQCYDLDSKALNIWDGHDWYNTFGAKANVRNYGVTEYIPNGDEIPIGFRFFWLNRRTPEGNTDGVEMIYKGRDTTDPNNPVDIWVDALGRKIDINIYPYPYIHKGPFINRPVLTEEDTWHQYFDTTNNRIIVWIGSHWIDAVGTRLTWGLTYELTNLTTTDKRPPEVGSIFKTTLNPIEGYSRPQTITISMGDRTLENSTGEYTYDSSTGDIRIYGYNGTGGVTGDLTITAQGVSL